MTAADQDVAAMLLPLGQAARAGCQQVRQVRVILRPEFYEFYNLGLGEPYRHFRAARLRCR